MSSLDRYRHALEAEMKQLVGSLDREPTHLYGMLHYHLGWATETFEPATVDGGKRIRPAILLLAAEAQGADWRHALPAAAAVELLHNFTLIHDDIEDRDMVRRGRPTLWALWDIPQAINAGDALFAISYRGIHALSSRGVPASQVLEALHRYTEVVIQITEGQCLDLAFESQDVVDEETYLRMIRGKTAALIGLVAELGGIIAGAPAPNRDALRAFGEALGMAFQMQDDLLGLWGNPARTGKPVGSDLRQRKKTLPILHGMQRSSALRRLIGASTFEESDVPTALRELERTGSQDYTAAQAHAYHEEAVTALARSRGTGAAQAALRSLAESLLDRTK
ncbi:MAG: polyprenyl synthetase family protein [Anaerolineae bacterium]